MARTENGRTTGYGYNELNQHNAATAPDQTDVAGVLARPAGEAVAVSVNGLPATVARIADPIFSALSSPISAGAEGVAWHRLGLPLTQGDNPFVVQASTASGQRVAQTNVVSVAAAPVFGYDGNGNMTTDGRFTYSWNDEDRLVSAVPVALTNGARKVEHVYDWMGRRILRTVSKLENNAWSPDNQTRYVYQGWNVIWETIIHAQAPQEASWNFWGLDLSGSVQGAGGVGGLLAVQMSPLPVGEGQGEGGTYFAAYDGNGNVMQYVGGQGALAAGFDYGPYGNVFVLGGARPAKLTRRYGTMPGCCVTDLVYYGYRFLSTMRGKWLSRDPIHNGKSAVKLVLYAGGNDSAYVVNNPIDNHEILGKLHARQALCVLCACGPFDAHLFSDVVDRVRIMRLEKFSDQERLNGNRYDHAYAARHNAWHHCVMSCEAHRAFAPGNPGHDPDCASKAMDCHEKFGTMEANINFAAIDTQADEYNNGIGKTLALQTHKRDENGQYRYIPCAESCDAALGEGSLALFDSDRLPDGTLYLTPEEMPAWWRDEWRGQDNLRNRPEGPYPPRRVP